MLMARPLPSEPNPPPAADAPTAEPIAKAARPASVHAPPEPAFVQAWEPKPNWRKPRSWTWVLLLPLGLLGAGIVASDPAELRRWFHEHVWAPPPVPEPHLLATAPPGTGSDSPQTRPSPPPAAGPVPENSEAPVPAAPSPSAEETQTPAPPALEPQAAPAEPVVAPVAPPPPPAVEAPPAPAPEPVAPAASAPAPPPAVPATPIFGPVAIRYRKGQSGADAEAARLLAQVQPLAAQADLRSTTTGYRTPTILFFRPEDRDDAESLSQVITAPGGPWTIRQGQGRRKAGALEVWIP